MVDELDAQARGNDNILRVRCIAPRATQKALVVARNETDTRVVWVIQRVEGHTRALNGSQTVSSESGVRGRGECPTPARREHRRVPEWPPRVAAVCGDRQFCARARFASGALFVFVFDRTWSVLFDESTASRNATMQVKQPPPGPSAPCKPDNRFHPRTITRSSGLCFATRSGWPSSH